MQESNTSKYLIEDTLLRPNFIYSTETSSTITDKMNFLKKLGSLTFLEI